MRRQVKPFVTEYRGNARRSKDLHSSGDLQSDTQTSRSRSYAEAEKVFHGEASDDSYEAALRAADALFDASPRVSEPLHDTLDARAPETQEVSPASMPRAAVLSEEDAEVATSEPPGAAAPPRRILQAIEPPAEDRFAVLEAERAPKRRGRTPGSKNKTKTVVGDDWSVHLPDAAKVSTLSASAPRARAPALEPALFLAEPEADEAAIDGEAVQQPRDRNNKFGWKRAGLRPGERWKRRLPKTAW